MPFLQRIRAERGAAALEALISMIFLVGVFFTMWSVARVINEQSRLDTGTQLAARAALQTYMRNAPAYCDGGAAGNLCTGGRNAAQQATANVLSMNVCGPGRAIGDADPENIDGCLGRLGIRQIGKLTVDPAGTSTAPSLSIQCATDMNAAEGSWKACSQTTGLAESKAIRAVLKTSYQTSWSIFSMIGGLGLSSNSFENTIYSNASAYSYAARLSAVPTP